MRNAGRGIARVDTGALWTRIDTHRTALQIASLNEVARQVGINPGTVRRIELGVVPDAHNLAALLFWLGERPWWICPRPGGE